MNNSDISVVLFDFDGVMCAPFRFAKVLAEQHGITTEMTKEFWTKTFTSALLGRVDVADIIPPFLTDWGWTGSVNEFLDLWLESEREIDPKMKETVKSVREAGVRVGLATNQEKRRATYMRTHMGISEMFDDNFISSELGVMKPEMEYFQKVTDLLCVNPEKILFIDDHKTNVEVANNFGWKAVHFESADKLAAHLGIKLARERFLSP